MSIYDFGYWTLVADGIVEYVGPAFPDPARYNLRSLDAAIESIKSEKTFYATDEAWRDALTHIELGRAMLLSSMSQRS